MKWLFVAAAVIGGCSTTPRGETEVSRTVEVEYSKFGACAYRALVEHGTLPPKLADLRGEETIVISLTNPTGFTGELTEVEFNIRKAGPSTTRVDIRSRFGITRASEAHWNVISKCAGPQ